MSISAVTQNNPNLVMKDSLWDGLQWVSMSTPAKSLILTSPSFGLYIPAYTNDRVIYGHPYETAKAEVNQANVEAFFSKMRPEEQQKYLINEGVDYILTTPENNTGQINYSVIDSIVVYQIEDVKIFLVKK